MPVDLFIAQHLARSFESSAEWRQRKAEQYPEDAERNLECAAQLSRMAEQMDSFEGGPWYERYLRRVQHQRLMENMQEEEERQRSDIGFVAMEPEEFFKALVEASGAEPGELDPNNPA